MKAASYSWLLVAILWVVACLNYLDRQVIFSVFPLLGPDLKLSGIELGLLGTAFLWAYGLLSPAAGFMADRFGREKAIVVSLLVWSAVTWATGHVRTFGELLGARALMGISEACYLPAALALIATNHGSRSRSLATGLHSSGIYAGMLLGGAGGGWLAQRYGWRPAFTFLGLIGIAYVGILGSFLKAGSTPTPAVSAEKPRFLQSLRTLMALRGFPELTVVFIATSIANWIVYTWLPLYLYEHFHMNLASAGFTATVYIQAASVAGILAGGWLADFWSRFNPNGRVLTQAVGLVASAPFLMVVGLTSKEAWLILSLIIFGLGKGFYDCNTMPVLCGIAPEGLRSTGYGIFNCAGCLAGGVAAPFAGWLREHAGLGRGFQIAGILLLLSVACLMRVRMHAAEPEPTGGGA